MGWCKFYMKVDHGFKAARREGVEGGGKPGGHPGGGKPGGHPVPGPGDEAQDHSLPLVREGQTQ